MVSAELNLAQLVDVQGEGCYCVGGVRERRRGRVRTLWDGHERALWYITSCGEPSVSLTVDGRNDNGSQGLASCTLTCVLS